MTSQTEVAPCDLGDMTNHRTLSLIFIALAMVSLLAGSATARSLLTGRDIKNGSITGADIKNRSLTSADFRGDPAGGALRGVRIVSSGTISVPPGSSTYDVRPSGWTAECPSGYTVIGTGFEADFGDMWSVTAYETFVGGFGTNDASINADFEVQAICARTGTGASAVWSTSEQRETRTRYAADVREMQARHQR
jgi:hypothetical protein